MHDGHPHQPQNESSDKSKRKSFWRRWFARANTHLSIGLGALAIDGGIVVTGLAFPDEIMLLELPYLEACMPGLVIFFGVVGIVGLISGLLSELFNCIE